jgi:diguanylate cyclase (GGDEF)-like protein/PAS domain S-box-containing protein
MRVSKTFTLNALLVLAIALCGYAMGLLTLPPFGASPFWLPAGLAVSGILIWGRQVLPAIFIGGLLLSIEPGIRASSSSFLFAVVSGLYLVLLAMIALFLLRRFRLWPETLFREKAILQFLAITTLVAPMLPALLMAITQSLMGQISLTQVLHITLFWWLGSAVGIVITVPMMLCLFASPRSVWQPRMLTLCVPMLCLLVLALIILASVKEREMALSQTRFDANVNVAMTLIENEVDFHQSLLQAMQAYFTYSEYVTADEFRQFSRDYSSHQRDIGYLAWLELKMSEGQTVEALEVRYHSQIEANEDVTRLQGLNLCEALGQEFCDELAGTEFTLIDARQLSPALPSGAGEYAYLQRVETSPDGISGWILQVVDYNTLFSDIFLHVPNAWVDFAVTNLRSGQPVFDSSPMQHGLRGRWQPVLEASHVINVMDQRWRIDFYPSSLFTRTFSSWLFYWVSLISLLLFGLTTSWLLAMSGRFTLVEEEVADKTRELNTRTELLALSERKYRRLVENIQDEYFLYSHDRDGLFHYVSPSVQPMLGYSQDEFMTHYSRYMPQSEKNRDVAFMTEQTLAGSKSNYELEIYSKQGKLHTLAVTEMPSYNEAGDIIGVEGIARDITDFKVSQQKLEKLSLAVEHSPNAVLIMDKSGQVEYVNPKFTAITGFSNDESLGKWPDLINSGVNPPGIYEEIWQRIRDGEEWRGELQNRKKNGDLYWAQELIAPMTSETGEVSHFVATQVDITEARRLSEETSYQATHDQLTGLINRREFDLRLDRVILAAKHNLTEHALCFLDLDQFKLVNDTCGHIAGDELLRQIGSLLQGNVRSRDTIARLGGDEFAILMEHCSIEQAFKACEQILQLLREFRFLWQDYTFTVGGSIGLAIIDQHTRDTNEALRNVDTACYSAKDAGRNRVEIHREDSLRLQQRRGEIQWSSEISEALDDDRFLLYAQPIKPLHNPELGMCYEVLVRLQRKDGEISPPGAFLPAAERYNSIGRIDRWVVAHAFEWLALHADSLGPITALSINLSGLSLGDESMLRFIINQLKNSHVPAEKVKFEITETAAIANLRSATTFIETLTEYGIRFSLDDFGSGLSSFAYLKKLRVHALKIDGMFVKDMLNDPLDAEMVKSINEIGHVMGLTTIAEFVESDAIMTSLHKMGVDYVQGYAIGKPVPIDDILLSS